MANQSVLSEHVVQHTVSAAEEIATTLDIDCGPFAYTANAILCIKRAPAGLTETGGTITVASTGIVTVADEAARFNLIEDDVITLSFVE